MPLLDVRNFNRRLWLSGGRDQLPDGACRLARGVAPELTGSIRSMYPPQLLYPNIAATALTRYNGNRYQCDGTNIYKNGTLFYNGGPSNPNQFNGGRATFVSMPPASGVPTYLFLTGVNQNIKIDPSGNVTNWGMRPPVNSMVATNNAQEQIVIDSFSGSAANYTSSGLTTKADESTIVAVGSGSLKLNPAGGAWSIQQAYGSAQNWGYYSGTGDFVLPTDIFQLWFYFDSYGSSASSAGTWIEIDIDVADGSFKKDWYSLAVGLIPSTTANPKVKHNVNFDVTFQTAQWQQITFPQSAFLRNGQRLQLDWTMVQAVQIKGGNFTGNLYLDNFTISGGAPLGVGPAAGQGGSEYSYYIVYRNGITGNQSNPQDTPTNVFANSCQRVTLTKVPVSADTQVTVRDIYRTSAENTGGGQTAFYLDSIYDNVTTTYTDTTGDTSIPKTGTPRVSSIAVPPTTVSHTSTAHYFIDGGNGYYFKLTTNGTTGGSPPAWNIPTATWAAFSAYVVGDTISPLLGGGNIFRCVGAGVTGATQIPWTFAFNTNALDGTVTWKNVGPATTTDGTAVWTFQGINSMPVLSNQAIRFDNTLPPQTMNDAVGPYQGSMIMTHDTATGAQGYVYVSPPGRAESIGVVVAVGTVDEPVVKAVIFQEQLFAITTRSIYRIAGTYPNFTPQRIYAFAGTEQQFTVFPTRSRVYYGASEAIRAFSLAGDGPVGFEAIAPVLRGQTVEDVPAFVPTVSGGGRDEVMFSDGSSLTMMLGIQVPTWRTFDVGMTAMFYEQETGEIIASYGGNVYLWEHESFSGSPLAYDWEFQTPSVETENSRQYQSQRVYIDINTAGQNVTPTLLVDGNSFVLPVINTVQRATIELPYHACGHVYGVNLKANPQTGIIEVFRVAADIA